ncbi:MAG TPA: SPOR domain-containing protein [Candidatus Saccharimonadales bacterium]|nr:SPOR domain-containing protein [Candidatus Saccharimonadales bacterium]
MLESKHVIGLFLLMLLFSGVFFTLGYVMGRSQYDGAVRAASNGMGKPESAVLPKSEPQPKKSAEPAPVAEETDPATKDTWAFDDVKKPVAAEPHLEPAPKTRTTPSSAPPSKTLTAKANSDAIPAPTPAKSSKPVAAPLIPSGAYVLQVAALLRQDDALAIASNLQKKHYSVYVQPPSKDKYYRVQVGPFKDQRSADAAKKGLESEGFRAFFVKH